MRLRGPLDKGSRPEAAGVTREKRTKCEVLRARERPAIRGSGGSREEAPPEEPGGPLYYYGPQSQRQESRQNHLWRKGRPLANLVDVGRILAEGGEDSVYGHIAMQAARSICDALGVRICGVLIDGLQQVFVHISLGLSHSMSKISYSQVVGTTSSQIKHFYQAGMLDLALQVGTWRHNFELELNQAIDPLLADLNSGKPVPAEHELWIERAYGSGGSNLDEVVEAMFGIRRPSELEQMEAEIYEFLVHKYYEARADA